MLTFIVFIILIQTWISICARIPIKESPLVDKFINLDQEILLIGGTRVIAEFPLKLNDSVSLEVNYNLVISFNDKRFYLFCCHENPSINELRSLKNTKHLENMKITNELDHSNLYLEDSLLSQNFDYNLTQQCVPVETCKIWNYADILKYIYNEKDDNKKAKKFHFIKTFIFPWTTNIEFYKKYLKNIYLRNYYFSSIISNKPIVEASWLNTSNEYGYKFYNLEIASTDEIYFNNTDGFLGLGYSFLNSSWNKYMSYTDNLWAIDLSILSNNSFLLSGINDITQHIKYNLNSEISKIIWSDTSLRMNDYILNNYIKNSMYELNIKYYATVYNINICGASLLSNFSSHIPLTINTHIEGLRLPYPIYSMIMEWISPLLKQEFVSLDNYPVLKLVLSPFEDETISIPLRDLVDTKYNNTLHIYYINEYSESYFSDNYKDELNSYDNSIFPGIELGTRFLYKYMTIIDIEKKRIGFLQKSSSIVSNIYCESKKKCNTYQMYYEPKNVCINPSCSMYGIQIWDESTQRCVVRMEVYILLVPLLIFLICLEICVIQCYKFISKPIYKHRRNVIIH